MANTKVTGDLIASLTIATGNIADNAVTSDKISGITTAHVTEGSNLYYTDARARGAVSVSGNALSYNSSTGVITSNFEESPVFTGDVTIGDNKSIISNGSVRIDIDNDNDSTTRAFLVRNNGGTNTLFRVQEDGNVGIGTTSPASLLHIKSTATTPQGITVEGGDESFIKLLTGGVKNWGLMTTNLAASDFGIYQSNANGGDPFTAGTAKLYFDGSGNVGIGIDDPAAKLEVKENLYVSHPNAEELTFRIDNYGTTGTDAGSLLRMFNQAGTTVVNIDSRSGSTRHTYFNQGGNVGIGTTSPSSLLTLNATSGGALQWQYNDLSYLRIEADSGGGSYYAAAGFYHRFFTSGSERMRITSDGNVGINYTGPFNQISSTETTLAISNSNIVALYLNNTSTNGHNQVLISGADGAFAVYDETVGANRFIIDSSGSVTVNSGNVQLVDSNKRITVDGSDIRIWQRSAANIQFLTNDLERMRIDSSGQVQVKATSGGDLLLYSTDTSLGSNQLIGRLGFYKSDASGAGAGVSDSIQVRSQSSIGANSYMSFHTDGGDGQQEAERMRIDRTGKVGIGITSPDATLHVDAGQNSGNLTNNVAVYIGGGFVNNDLYHREGGLLVISGTNATQTSAGIAFQTRNTGNTNYWKSSILMNRGGELEFYTGGAGTGQGSVRMRITSGGDVLIGTQGTPNGTSVYGSAFTDETSNRMILRMASSTTGAVNLVQFYNGNGLVGKIQTSGSATSYITSSDYRLKENVVEMTGALDRVSQLKPSRFNFITDADKTVDGFLAHEVQEIVPEAISGEKDAIDEEGNPEYQGIDQSKLVPLLVGAIQELKAEIETLKTQINN